MVAENNGEVHIPFLLIPFLHQISSTLPSVLVSSLVSSLVSYLVSSLVAAASYQIFTFFALILLNLTPQQKMNCPQHNERNQSQSEFRHDDSLKFVDVIISTGHKHPLD
jgi:hypothetical protein